MWRALLNMRPVDTTNGTPALRSSSMPLAVSGRNCRLGGSSVPSRSEATRSGRRRAASVMAERR